MNLIKLWRKLTWPIVLTHFKKVCSNNSRAYPVLLDLEMNPNPYKEIYIEKGFNAAADQVADKYRDLYTDLFKQLTCKHEILIEADMEEYCRRGKNPNNYYLGTCTNCKKEICYDKLFQSMLDFHRTIAESKQLQSGE